jgi:hypothetical protein
MECGVSIETAESWSVVMSQWKLLSHGVWCLFGNNCIMGCGVSLETADSCGVVSLWILCIMGVMSLWKLLIHEVWCLY